ncbi:MAG: phosphate ABC transporter permease PstA [Bdellovibrionales bacterium]
MSRTVAYRKIKDRFMHFLLALLCVLVILPLANVFWFVLSQGWSAVNLDFFIHTPAPVGEVGGGIGNALLGSLIIVGIASMIGVPWGVSCGIFLSEYSRSKFAKVLRFSTDLLTSVPSIVIGLFTYAAIVVPMKGFSALAGGISLAVIMIPSVARTTEEMLKLIPDTVREAGLALGIPRWKVITRIVLRGGLGGVVTGIMLSIARVTGETAPLLFTAFNNRFWSTSVTEPIASLPVQIFTYAISPYEDWHRQAWAAALVLLMFVFVINLTTRLLLAGRTSKGE